MMLKERVAVMNHLRCLAFHSPELRIGMLFYYFENTLTQKILKISQKCSQKMDSEHWAGNAYTNRSVMLCYCESGIFRVKVKLGH